MSKPGPHLLLIEPIQDEETVGVDIPDQLREAHVQLGWVIDTGWLEEAVEPDDLVVFVGWKEKMVPQSDYAHWRDDWFILHEDDIELVIEEW